MNFYFTRFLLKILFELTRPDLSLYMYIYIFVVVFLAQTQLNSKITRIVVVLATEMSHSIMAAVGYFGNQREHFFFLIFDFCNQYFNQCQLLLNLFFLLIYQSTEKARVRVKKKNNYKIIYFLLGLKYLQIYLLLKQNKLNQQCFVIFEIYIRGFLFSFHFILFIILISFCRLMLFEIISYFGILNYDRSGWQSQVVCQ